MNPSTEQAIIVTGKTSRSRSPKGRGPGRPKGVLGEDTRRQILEAASECIDTYGLNATSLTAIAKRVGITRAAIYNYFESKEAIARAVVLELEGRRPIEPLGRRWWTDPLPASATTTTAKLSVLLTRSYEEAVAERNLNEQDFYLQMIRASKTDRELRSALIDFVGDQRETFRAILLDGIAGGELDESIDLERVLDGLQGLVWAVGVSSSLAPNATVAGQVRSALELMLQPVPGLT